VSSTGRYVWSERPFTLAFDGTGGLELDGQDMVLGEGGRTLSSAFRAAADSVSRIGSGRTDPCPKISRTRAPDHDRFKTNHAFKLIGK
jgi:hypothetical protein